MIKNFSGIEIKVGEKIYKFICETDSAIGEVHDVLTQMKSLVIQRMSDSHVSESSPKDISPEKSPTVAIEDAACQ